MAPSANTFGTPGNEVGNLNGFFKETYANKLEQLIPDGVKLLNKIPFLPKDKQPGNLYHQPVILGLEHGVTFANSTDDAFNLQPAIAGQTKDAEVRGNPLVLRSVLGYTAASRAAQGTAKAFEDGTKYLVSNMLRSVTKKLEIELLYGQKGYATVASTTGALIVITTSEWAPGIWAGAEGMPIEIRNAAGSVSRGVSTVASVDFLAQTITTTSVIPGVVATDVIWHKGAYGNEFPGIHMILTMTTGILFNINVAEYNLFRGNQYDAGGGALSFTKITQATERAMEKGLDGKAVCYCNPRGWTNMMSDQAALRKYDGSYKVAVAENGSEKLVFNTLTGAIEIEASIYIKQGYAFVLAMDEWCRVGSSDVTFKRPSQGDEFFRDLSDAAGYELRLWSDQALFTSAPGRNTVIFDIVNSN